MATYIVEGVKSFPGDLTSASGVRAGQSFWTIEYEGYYRRARFASLSGIPLQVAGGLAHGQGGLVHTTDDASGVRVIGKHTGWGVEDKCGAIIAQFARRGLAFFRERGGSSQLEKPRSLRGSIDLFTIVA